MLGHAPDHGAAQQRMVQRQPTVRQLSQAEVLELFERRLRVDQCGRLDARPRVVGGQGDTVQQLARAAARWGKTAGERCGEVTEERDFVGLWATSVQHQIDHLNGRMYFDRLSKVKRDMLVRKARKKG